MAGVERSVSPVVYPALGREEPLSETRLVGTFARDLGRMMPIWYGLNLLLLDAAIISGAQDFRLAAAGTLWAVVSLLTLLFLVPLNNHLAQLDPRSWTEGTRRTLRAWDRRHRVRAAARVAALVCFSLGALV